MIANKNPFQVAAYQKVFQEILGSSEMTNKDECLAEMDEPMGKKYLICRGRQAIAHRSARRLEV